MGVVSEGHCGGVCNEYAIVDVVFCEELRACGGFWWLELFLMRVCLGWVSGDS